MLNEHVIAKTSCYSILSKIRCNKNKHFFEVFAFKIKQIKELI